jgi:hypothetical protein
MVKATDLPAPGTAGCDGTAAAEVPVVGNEAGLAGTPE